jgi:hypothetical protein
LVWHKNLPFQTSELNGLKLVEKKNYWGITR